MEAVCTYNAIESTQRFVSLYKQNGVLNVFCVFLSKRRKQKTKKKISATLIEYQMHFTGIVNPKVWLKLLFERGNWSMNLLR